MNNRIFNDWGIGTNIGFIWGIDRSAPLTMPYYLYDKLSEFYKQNKFIILNDLKFNRYKYDILIDLDFFYICDYIFTTNKDILKEFGFVGEGWYVIKLESFFFFDKRIIIKEAFWNLIYLIINNFFFFLNKENYWLCYYFKSNYKYFFKNSFYIKHYDINLNFTKLKKIKIKNLNFKTIDYNFNYNDFNPIIIYEKYVDNILLILHVYQNISDFNIYLTLILKKLIKLEIDKNFIFFIYIILHLKPVKIINIKNLKLINEYEDYKILKSLFKIKTINFYNFDKKKLKKLNLDKLMLLLINLPEFSGLTIINFNFFWDILNNY